MSTSDKKQTKKIRPEKRKREFKTYLLIDFFSLVVSRPTENVRVARRAAKKIDSWFECLRFAKVYARVNNEKKLPDDIITDKK